MARNRIEFAVRVKDDASANLQRISKETDALTGSFKRLAGAAISIGTAVEIARLADTYRLLQNRLRLVTSGTAELKRITSELVEISIRSRTSFQSTADLFSRVARSSRTLGLSQQELLGFTETVTKSIRISGSTAQEAAAGVIQFGQALASSRLSGDELRSVLEQMPRLAQAIADGMGVGIGRLRELGETGDLTAVKVLDALRKAGPAIESEFAQLTPLVSEAFGNLQTALSATIGLIDEQAGISAKAADTIIDLADGMLIFGKAITGTLAPAELISENLRRISIFALTTAAAFETLILSTKAVAGPAFQVAGEFLGAVAAQIATGGSSEEVFAIGRDFNKRFIEAFTGESLTDAREEIISRMADTMEKIGMIIGDFPRIKIEPIDLTISDEAANEGTRKQRDAIARATKNLQNMFEAIRRSNAAFVLAKIVGLEYADALDIVKANALAAASGNIELQIQVLNSLELQRQLRAEAKAAEQAAKDAAKAAEANLKFAEALAERAAQNIQDAFANFLFDPFEDGVRGMLLGFINAVRTMLSQALAFKLLTNLPGSLGNFFTPGRAAGGPVTAGQPVLVGERGPEIFIPGASGNILNNSVSKGLGGGATFVTNIDARGADPGLISRLPGIMEQRDRLLMLKVKRFIEDGGILI